MKTPDSNLSVWVGDNTVWVRVEGRANFHCSVDFKTLVTSLWQRGYRSFHLDLTNCLLMDSTFLGVLTGLGLKLEPEQHQAGGGKPIQLHNPNNRISDLLENLGVMQLFDLCQEAGRQPTGEYQVQPSCNATPEEMTRTSLKAHETLMEVEPANVPKFKEVAKFLAEDLKKFDRPGEK